MHFCAGRQQEIYTVLKCTVIIVLFTTDGNTEIDTYVYYYLKRIGPTYENCVHNKIKNVNISSRRRSTTIPNIHLDDTIL